MRINPKKEKRLSTLTFRLRHTVVGRSWTYDVIMGTGAWRVRSSMNELSALLDMTCTVDIGLMPSIKFIPVLMGNDAFSRSLCLAKRIRGKYIRN